MKKAAAPESANHQHRNNPTAKQAPKKHRAYLQILHSGMAGITENGILRTCHLSSGRNYLTQLERDLRITFTRCRDKNPDGVGSHYRYVFASREDVKKVISHLNESRKRHKTDPLTQSEVSHILAKYPEQDPHQQ